MSKYLDALQLRLSNERVRLSYAKSEQERQLRAVYIIQIEKEIEQEREYLSLSAICTLSDDDVL